MKKLSLLTVITAISSITLLVSCGQNRNSRYGTNGRYCSPQHYSGGQNQYGSGYNRGYNQQGGGYNRGYNQQGGGYDQGYDQQGGGYNRGYNQHGGGYDQGYDQQGGGYNRGYNQHGGGYDPTCNGRMRPYPAGHRYPDPHGCGMYGQRYSPAQFYQGSGAYFCFETGFGMGSGYPRGSINSGQTETLLCDVNEQPDAACPQGHTCQQVEGDVGICS